MKASLLFFYLPSVSKSLLIVLGTLSVWKPCSQAHTRCAWLKPLARAACAPVFRSSANSTGCRFALVKAHGAMRGNLGNAPNAQSGKARFGEEALTIPARHPVAERRAEKQK